MTAVRVVVGPLTRLGRRVGTGEGTRLVARHDADAKALADLGAGTVVRADERDPAVLVGTGDGPVEVVVCALGPIHPDEPDSARDTEAYRRDLDLLAAVVDAAGPRPLHVVLVSTVVAIAPGEDRRYYGGWKALVEQDLAGLLARRAPSARLSVLYPGRILDAADRSRPWHRLHATYDAVAARVEATLGQARHELVGLDARLWVLTRSLSLLLTVLRPRGSRAALTTAETSPATEASSPTERAL